MGAIENYDKIKSAYALNLCTVSISQIVDYDDLNILEQEYDAILNNLNLEKIIKNDSLLNILKQILDTVTYFKMEDIDRKIIEEEYQQETQNALWAAVPNFGLIVAGGSPLTMAISLASQVGIGYMNYRRIKNDSEWKKKKSLLKLQRAAIEQLNALRRELFTTAWNLAEKYEFPDEYRLTEKQIKQYNNILDDSDVIRKYERLDFIKDNFSAYPPFWYFFGSTANYIARNNRLELGASVRDFYRNKARECFETYDKLDQYTILRENQITSSFALEYAELLLDSSAPDTGKVKALIDRAAAMAPNSYDVLELCAIAYLRINDRASSARLLKFLVNEKYNKIINAQLLSSIWVHDNNYGEYEILKTRVPQQYLYPMPKAGQTPDQAEKEFEQKQKELLKQKYALVIDDLVEKYIVQWNKISSTFENEEYPDSFFSSGNKLVRMAAAEKIFRKKETKAAYLNTLKDTIQLCMLDVLNDSITGLFSLPALIGSSLKDTAVNIVRKNIIEKRADLLQLLDKLNTEKFSIDDYKDLQEFSLESLYGKEIIQNIKRKSNEYLDQIDCEKLTNEETRLRVFCAEQKITFPEFMLGKVQESQFSETALPFTPEIFGADAVSQQKHAEKMKALTALANDFRNNIPPKEELQILLKEDNAFDTYFSNSIFNKIPALKEVTFMIFRDSSPKKFDLIFTPDGIVSVIKSDIQPLTKYSEIILKDGKLLLSGSGFFTDKEEYSSSAIDSSTIFRLAKEIETVCAFKMADYLYIVETLNKKYLLEWFRQKQENYLSGITEIIAYPDKDILSSLGIDVNFELTKSKHIVQIISEEKSDKILLFRIVEFTNIDPDLRAKLEKNGVVLVKD